VYSQTDWSTATVVMDDASRFRDLGLEARQDLINEPKQRILLLTDDLGFVYLTKVC
jgi:hypothetical protein